MPEFPIQPSKPLPFLADAMLGRLARWLRILGYDTAYEKFITDEMLTERAFHEDRWLLTRDRRLVLRKLLRGRHTLIASDLVEGQLRQLHRDLKIDLDIAHQRDYRCADRMSSSYPFRLKLQFPSSLPLSRSAIRCFFNALDAARSFGQEPTGSISWTD